MDDKIAAFTIFTFFLFTVSAARFPVAPPATNPAASDDASKLAETSRESTASGDSHILLPRGKVKPDSDESTANNPLPESGKTTNDLTQRTNYSRFHPINRHFHGKPPRAPIGTYRRPYRKSVSRNRVPRTEAFYRNDEIASRGTDNSNPETFPGEVPANWLNARQYHDSRRHRDQSRNNDEKVMKTRNVFDREKFKSLIRQHKQKKIEEETGFMKNIRKFLKHTFD